MTTILLSPQLTTAAAEIRTILEQLLPAETTHNSLYAAMRYSALAEGKALRGFLTLATATMLNVPRHYALRVTAAIEMIHCYSLVHDDLPAMDNDDWRRGKPSCHIAFGEATAILVGDGLLTFAFQLLAHPSTHPDATIRCLLIEALTKAIGPEGMVGGQNIDIQHSIETFEDISTLHRLKTGALFAVSCEAGAILSGADPTLQHRMRCYGEQLGIAFQIYDDIEDYHHPKHAQPELSNIVRVLGPEQARGHAENAITQALEALRPLGSNAAELITLLECLPDFFSLD